MSEPWRPEAETEEKIKQRRYECFMEDHDEKPWTPGQCADYAGRGSLALHLFRCKRKDGHGLGGLFCKQHAQTRGEVPQRSPPTDITALRDEGGC